MTTYRTLTVATALALSAFAAQADSSLPRDGYWSDQPLAATEASTTLTREAVIADLVASRKAGTLPRDGEWYNVPAPLGSTSSGGWLPGWMPTATSNAPGSGDK